MSRKFARISGSDLMVKIKALGTEEDYVPKAWDGPNDGFEFHELVSNLKKDLKVEFDCENSEYENDRHDKNSLLGIQELPNGLTFCGCYAGGDWEGPVFFIIYWDGKVRAYIPTDGNPWNRTSKQAYGNDEDGDLADAIKHGFAGKDDTYFDGASEGFNWSKIMLDILKRIEPA